MDGKASRTRMICIVCPVGCELEVEVNEDRSRIVQIKGFKCPKGEEYAIREVTDPRRILMTVVRVRGGHLPIVSVKTVEPIPRGRLADATREISRMVVDAPVRVGDIVVSDLLDTGVSVVATNNVHR